MLGMSPIHLRAHMTFAETLVVYTCLMFASLYLEYPSVSVVALWLMAASKAAFQQSNRTVQLSKHASDR